MFDPEAVGKISHVEKVSLTSEDGIATLKVMAPRGEDILSDVIKEISDKTKILMIETKEPTLEDVFIYYTGRSLKNGEASA